MADVLLGRVMYALSRWCKSRWEHDEKQRYYEVVVAQDLWAEWTVMRVWGGIGSARGRVVREHVADRDSAARIMGRVAKRRHQRGYRLVLTVH